MKGDKWYHTANIKIGENKKVMTCYLHIGTEKTGTTSIQNFLYKNRDQLLKDGILFSQSLGKRNNRGLSVLAYSPGKFDDYIKTLNLNDESALKKHQKKLFSNLKNELEREKSKKVLFSSEHIHSRLTTIKEIYDLKRILEKLGFTKIIILVYLRDPAGIATSLYSTAVKYGDNKSKFPNPPQENNYYEHICNHERTLNWYGEVFGEDNLRVRIFEKDALINGSLIDDFLSIIEIEKNENYKDVVSKNISLNLIGLTLLRELNKEMPRFIDNKPNPARGNLVALIEKHFEATREDKQYKYAMPQKLYNEYNEYFLKSNEYVRQKFFPQKSTLFNQKMTHYRENFTLHSEDELMRIIPLIVDLYTCTIDKSDDGDDHLMEAKNILTEIKEYSFLKNPIKKIQLYKKLWSLYRRYNGAS